MQNILHNKDFIVAKSFQDNLTFFVIFVKHTILCYTHICYTCYSLLHTYLLHMLFFVTHIFVTHAILCYTYICYTCYSLLHIYLLHMLFFVTHIFVTHIFHC